MNNLTLNSRLTAAHTQANKPPYSAMILTNFVYVLMNNCDDEEMNQKHSSWEHAWSYVQNWPWSRNTFHNDTAGIKRKYTHYTTAQLYRITSTMRTNTQVNSCTSMTSCLNHETQTTGDCSYRCWVVVMLGYILAGLPPIMWWSMCSCLRLTGAEKPHKCWSKDVQTTLPEPLWNDKETWLQLPEIKQKLTNQHTCLVKEQKSSFLIVSCLSHVNLPWVLLFPWQPCDLPYYWQQSGTQSSTCVALLLPSSRPLPPPPPLPPHTSTWGGRCSLAKWTSQYYLGQVLDLHCGK